MGTNQAAVELYRKLVHAASAIKTQSQRNMTLRQIKSEFARGRKLTAADKYACYYLPKKSGAQPFCCRIDAGLSKAEEQLKYIHSTLPRVAKMRLEARQRLNGEHAATAYVVQRGGKVVEGTGAKVSTAAHKATGVDPDQLARHNANLRRFKFMDRGLAAPKGPQWTPDR